ncbi:MAG: replication-associated recombination protein A [Actinomycetota bacterium]|nr:replication-associated recombination protein A [Actinomycetota bacterium]
MPTRRLPAAAGADLFEHGLEERLRARGPLASRLRPTSLDAVVGQDHLLGPDGALRALVEARRLISVILWGPAGTGKTTIARLLADAVGAAFESLSAVSAGVKDVREAAELARRRLAENGTSTVLLLDEVHRFSRSQQDALLPSVEDGTLTLVGATTENPFFEVNGPLLSRSTLFRLEPLDVQASRTLLDRGLAAEGGTIDEQAAEAIVGSVDGDGRALLTTLEVALAIAGKSRHVTLGNVERARTTRALTWGRDDHYDVISAFIKSIRGSDPDAGLHWLARMIVAGEDPRFIARRLVVLASEDVGMADPTSLLVASAAAHAVEYVGLPEAQLNLAQAVVHLATAPKSNRSALGIWQALDDVRSRPAGAVPPHLRDAHYRSAERIGHGVGYRYPHDDPRGWVEQDYLPDQLAGTRYYQPSGRGHEADVTDRLGHRYPPRS